MPKTNKSENSKNTKNTKNKKDSIDIDIDEDSDLALQYQKKTLKEHILDLPDTYIGDIATNLSQQYLLKENEISLKNFYLSLGLMNIIEEILVNAFDRYSRTNKQKASGIKGIKTTNEIKVSIKNKKTISIENNGDGIDIAKHPSEDIWIPQMIFGELLTSGNYNKQEEKITGGKNGYGAKLTNIYSTKFILETVDKKRKLKYTQVFENNMDVKGEPKIENYTDKPYTKITFTPDYQRFNCEELSDDLCALIKKRTYDMVACSSGKIKVSYNGNPSIINDFNDYISLYIGSDTPRICQTINDRWSIAACLSTLNDGGFQQVSFVNGINTNKGGKHVEYITKQIIVNMVKYIEKKKKIKVKENTIKENLMVFVNSVIVNPSFDSQTKETLTTNKSKFGSVCLVPDKFIETLAVDCGVMEQAIMLNEFQSKKLLKATDGKKNKKILDIPKLDDADLAGSSKSAQTTLILTEGDSAKAMAVAGIGVLENGRKLYGIFPLRGKLRNDRNLNAEEASKNEELTNIKRIMGLREGAEYKDVNNLRYGRIMIMTDQDVDGTHIKGLIMNFLSKWPSLMKIEGFITSLLTPIVKVRRGKQVKNFYTLPEYNQWIEKNSNNHLWKAKYYKGLGTSTPAEAKEYFREFKILKYHWDDNTDAKLDLAFNKDQADNRKIWLGGFDCNRVLDLEQSYVTISDFIDKDLIHFSNADNIRSIPSLCDGFKPGQRKIYFCCEKRNLKNELRVSQLSGYVSENGAYHHGEVSLQGTIINMAQNHCGANNINLLEPVGQFGSRLKGGKDHAQPRYLNTHFSTMAAAIFNKLDNPVYKYIEDDGLKVEPEQYMPIVPMVLINGTEGIGTGWSSGVPQFHPLEIVENLKELMKGNTCKEMIPWFRGFSGEIEKTSDNHWLTRGKYKLIKNNCLEITELPIGVWTDNYRIMLDEFLQGINNSGFRGKPKSSKTNSKTTGKGNSKKNDEPPLLKDYRNESTEATVKFTLIFDTEVLQKLMATKNKDGISKLETTFKLVSKISCGKKLNLYTKENKLKSYTTCEEILVDYYEERALFYQKRKDYMMAKMENDLLLCNIKIKFILEVIEGKIKINNQSKAIVIQQLEKRKYPKMLDHRLITLENLLKENSTKQSDANYDFLIKMPIYNLTKERIEELKKERDELQSEYDKLKVSSIAQLWSKDLSVFETVYKKFMKSYYQYMSLNPDDYGICRKKKSKITLKKK